MSGWTVQAKLDVYMWFGLVKHKKEMLKGLPAGYVATKELKQAIKMAGVPPPFITYKGIEAGFYSVLNPGCPS